MNAAIPDNTAELEVIDNDEAETPQEFSPVLSKNQMNPITAKNLLSAFQPFLQTAKKWQSAVDAIVVTDISQTKEMEMARTARLELKHTRVALEKKKKELKENILRDGRIIDGFFNVCNAIITPLEESFREKEEFAERFEAKRILELKLTREKELSAFGVDVAGYNLETLPEASYLQLLEMSKASFEKKKAEEAERIEKERVAAENARLEQIRIREENLRLQKEAAEREAKNRKEREALEKKVQAEKAAAAKKAQIEKDALEEKARKERLILETRLKKEREEKEKVERELREKQEAEEKAKRLAEEEALRKAAAPDREKLKEFAKTIRSLQIPTLFSPNAKKVQKLIKEQNEKYADWIDGQILKL